MLKRTDTKTIEELFEHNLEKHQSEVTDYDNNLFEKVKKMDPIADKIAHGKEIQRMILMSNKE